MDRFTWGVVLGVVILCIAAIAALLAGRSVAPDMVTPEGTVTAYMVALQERDAETAWDLLTGAQALSRSGVSTTRDSFRNEVNSAHRQPNKRLRLLNTRSSGDTAQVDVEVVPVGSGVLFTSSPSRTVTFSLVRRENGWRINSAPSVWELT